MKKNPKSEIGGVIDAMEKEIASNERKAVSEAQLFSKRKKEEMRAKARNDNKELLEMEKKNIEREIRREEEKIREQYLLGLVQAKESSVDAIWDSAKRKFLSMPKRKTEYRKFLRKIISSVKNIKDYDVFMRKEDRNFYKGARQKRMAGGAIFRSRDGKIEIDHSLEGIAERYKGKTRARISEVLFR